MALYRGIPRILLGPLSENTSSLLGVGGGWWRRSSLPGHWSWGSSRSAWELDESCADPHTGRNKSWDRRDEQTKHGARRGDRIKSQTHGMILVVVYSVQSDQRLPA
jgi:hypothetical protein